jgi:hypothetical protein
MPQYNERHAHCQHHELASEEARHHPYGAHPFFVALVADYAAVLDVTRCSRYLTLKVFSMMLK